MKFSHSILIAAALALTVQSLPALDGDALTAAVRKFDGASPEDQYKARVELNQLIDQATAPGKDAAAVSLTLSVASINVHNS